ncbi:TetR/AcrR family transcriptional regulator [Sphingobacterium sp. Lzh-3]|uniref:TetR/AcrR family transcriptional regulator n=1 Tax=unclassified Sphingobacterium TaxID=2609468 RepID=UPI002955DFE3|nr:TetR/AcrR family transcriptional regulator [Sphingobacterium sp. UGAL515B_05]WON93729.1 TetR/AcrR family transcriptional regulator [Sphingobacterium sp. UGAL515B_05]
MLTKAEKTKQFILETASPLYNEKGISGVSIDDVLEATKLTKGCIYGHFSGKEDLSEQVVEYSINKMTEKVAGVVSKGKTAKEKVFLYLDFYSNPIDTPIAGGCPIFNTAVEADDNFPAIKQKVAAVVNASLGGISTILKKGIADGEFSNQLNVDVFAFKILSAVEGALVLSRTIGSTKLMLQLIQDLKKDLEHYTL